MSITIKHEDFYQIPKKELDKFFKSVQFSSIELDQQQLVSSFSVSKNELVKDYMEGYKEFPYIDHVGIFTLHPYLEKTPWLLYKRMSYPTNLSFLGRDKLEKYVKSRNKWQAYFNNNLKKELGSNFPECASLPRVEINVTTKLINKTKAAENLFQNEKENVITPVIKLLSVKFKLGDVYLINSILNHKGTKYNLFGNSIISVANKTENFNTEELSRFKFLKSTSVNEKELFLIDEWAGDNQNLPVDMWDTTYLEQNINTLIDQMLELRYMQKVEDKL